MTGLTVSTAIAGLTNILWAPLADLTVSAAMLGLNNILWAPMDDLTVSALTAGLTNILYLYPNSSFRLQQSTSFANGLSVALSFLPVLVGGGWCLNHGPLTHPRLCRGTSYSREIQLTLRISTRMSYVGSPSTNSHLYRH